MNSFRILALYVLIIGLLTTACCGGSSSADEIAIKGEFFEKGGDPR